MLALYILEDKRCMTKQKATSKNHKFENYFLFELLSNSSVQLPSYQKKSQLFSGKHESSSIIAGLAR